MALSSYLISEDFVVLDANKKATVEPCDADLYQRLGQNYCDFKGHELIAAHEFREDWNTWEIHPHGDEIVILLSGQITFILQLESGDESISLNEAGAYAIVPQNVWHTAKTSVKTKVLFITPGEGTQNKSV